MGKEHLKKNIGTVYQIAYFDGYETFEIKDYVDFFKALKKYPEKLLSLLNVRYIIALEKDDYFADEHFYHPLLLSKRDRIKIIENKKCFERAFITNNVVCFNSKNEVLNKICEPGFDFATVVAIESETPYQTTANVPGLPSSNDVCEIVVYNPDYVRINATVKEDSFLVLSDTFYPGWKGYVDGKKEPVLRANYILRALFLRKGNHTIEFRYEPTSFRIGIAVTALTVLLLLVLLLYKKKNNQYQR